MSMFQQAKKEALSVKIALEGPAGSGKTYSALLLSKGMGGRTALIDTENRSSCLYANIFNFDMAQLAAPFNPERYVEMIKEAEKAGYENIIIDSGSHEWEGDGGALDIVTDLSKGASSFNAWAKVTPRHNKFIRAILDSPVNIIVCFRTKTAYEIEQGTNRAGNTVSIPKKIGTKPITREGFDFECTIVFALAVSNLAEQTKDRTGLYIGIQKKLDESDGQKIKAFLNDGVKREPTAKVIPEDRKKKLFDWCVCQWKDLTSPPLMEEVEINSCFRNFGNQIAGTSAPFASDWTLEEVEAVAAVLNKNHEKVALFVSEYIQEAQTDKEFIGEGEEQKKNTFPAATQQAGEQSKSKQAKPTMSV